MQEFIKQFSDRKLLFSFKHLKGYENKWQIEINYELSLADFFEYSLLDFKYIFNFFRL